jgi:RNase P/RNase MRP subunit POP5
MTVKEKRGRRRYLYFEVVDGEIASNEEMLQAIVLPANRMGLRSFKSIQFDGRKGIVRCALVEAERLRDIINRTSSPVRPFRTICTSGTVRTLKERYFPEQRRDRNIRK